MEIMLIGDFSENFDEGMKNIAKYVYKYLSKKHNVKSLNVKHLISRQTLENLKKNNIKTREKVLSYSWENLVKRLEDLYFRLLEEKRGK